MRLHARFKDATNDPAPPATLPENQANGKPEAPAPIPPAGRAGETAAPALLPWLLSIQQTALVLGVSSKTVKRMAGGGELPGVVRIGRRVLIDRAKLQLWIGQGCPPVTRRGRR
jgi:excisionase family DNA binding protein